MYKNVTLRLPARRPAVKLSASRPFETGLELALLKAFQLLASGVEMREVCARHFIKTGCGSAW